MKIQEGDLLMVRTRTLFGQMIRMATGDEYSHCENVVERFGELHVIGATWPRVRMVKLSTYLNNHQDVLVLRPASLNRAYYRHVLFSALGLRYDFSAIFEQMRFQLTGRRRWRGRTGPAATRRYYCSELSAYAHDRENWHQTWPGHLPTDPYFTEVVSPNLILEKQGATVSA